MKRFLLFLTVMMLLVPSAALADMQSAGEWARSEAEKLDESARVVNVYTWTYYIPDEVVAAFEQASGIRVNYTPFSSNEEMLAKLQATPGQFDLAVCSDYIIDIMGDEGMMAELDSSRLPNYLNIDPAYQGQYYDPENRFTVPYTNTVPLIVYDPDMVDFEITSYADLWREEFRGALAVVDDQRNIIGMAQKKLGMSFNETDPEAMARVAEELAALKDNITVFNADTPHFALIGGDAVAGYMFGSQIVAARAEMPQLKVAYPEEGLNFGIDCLVMPKDAPHADAAYILINYLLDGEVSAMASDLIDYGSCNLAAVEFMTEEFKADETVNVPADLLATAEMFQPLSGADQTLYDEIWTEFRK